MQSLVLEILCFHDGQFLYAAARMDLCVKQVIDQCLLFFASWESICMRQVGLLTDSSTQVKAWPRAQTPPSQKGRCPLLAVPSQQYQ